LATLQAIIVVGIQAAIAYENSTESKKIIVSNVDQLLQDDGYANERFDRMRWENIAFCGYQIWFCAMAYDSVRLFDTLVLMLCVCICQLICLMFCRKGCQPKHSRGHCYFRHEPHLRNSRRIGDRRQ
jgi:hypothetical protein